MGEESVGDAGANHLGYYTGVWSPDGRGIAAHGFTGALHTWRRLAADPPAGSAASAASYGEEEGGWLPRHALGGHYGPVVDACWAADGACLLTVSTDQTARITTQLASGHWCEVARPQVHGHDFAAVAALPPAPLGGNASGTGPDTAQPERFLFASGSEEKVVRVFEAPRAFRDTLAMARGRPVGPAPSSKGGAGGGASALGALLPALGLSNKAVFDDDEEGPGAAGGGDASGGVVPTGAAAYTEGPDLAPNAAPSAVAGPPLEEHLAQNTLWPEVHKLYGHGNELYCLAAGAAGGGPGRLLRVRYAPAPQARLLPLRLVQQRWHRPFALPPGVQTLLAATWPLPAAPSRLTSPLCGCGTRAAGLARRCSKRTRSLVGVRAARELWRCAPHRLQAQGRTLRWAAQPAGLLAGPELHLWIEFPPNPMPFPCLSFTCPGLLSSAWPGPSISPHTHAPAMQSPSLLSAPTAGSWHLSAVTAPCPSLSGRVGQQWRRLACPASGCWAASRRTLASCGPCTGPPTRGCWPLERATAWVRARLVAGPPLPAGRASWLSLGRPTPQAAHPCGPGLVCLPELWTCRHASAGCATMPLMSPTPVLQSRCGTWQPRQQRPAAAGMPLCCLLAQLRP